MTASPVSQVESMAGQVCLVFNREKENILNENGAVDTSKTVISDEKFCAKHFSTYIRLYTINLRKCSDNSVIRKFRLTTIVDSCGSDWSSPQHSGVYIRFHSLKIEQSCRSTRGKKKKCCPGSAEEISCHCSDLDGTSHLEDAESINEKQIIGHLGLLSTERRSENLTPEKTSKRTFPIELTLEEENDEHEVELDRGVFEDIRKRLIESSDTISKEDHYKVLSSLTPTWYIHKIQREFKCRPRPSKSGETVPDSGIALVEQEVVAVSFRQQWSRPIEFLLSCISMSVGLGNLWRFPFTAYENGGGAFLIPYLIVLVFIGRPLYLLELSLGQFKSGGCVKIWDMSPPFRGIGYSQALAAFIVNSYYCALIAISMHYLFSSFQSVLPWTVCDPRLRENSTLCLPSNQSISMFNTTHRNLSVISSAEQYFRQGVLKEKIDISDGIGLPDPALLGYLVLSWAILFLTLIKGVSSSGKVAYLTSIFPYVVLLTLLVRGLTLPGSAEGVIFFFRPDWHRLYDLNVWYAAITQSFFSLGVGFGCITTFSSYNPFTHNIYKDATIISVADTCTSILAGVVTFSILGHLAHELELPVGEVVKSGAGLAFVSYPEVVSKFEAASQFFAVLFFLMLITLGLGTAIAYVNTVITIVCDDFPSVSKLAVTAVVCVLGLILGIVFTTPGGQAMLELVDYYSGGLVILIMAVAEIFVISWVYKTSNVIVDLNFMMQRRLGYFWRFCWSYLIPAVLLVILIYMLVFHEPVKYAKVELPLAAEVTGWSLAMLGPAILSIILISTIVRFDGWRKNFRSVFSPLRTWGPKDVADRLEWINYKHEVLDNVQTIR